VHELGREQAARALPAQLAINARAHELDVALGARDRAGDSVGVSSLDPRALVRRRDRP